MLLAVNVGTTHLYAPGVRASIQSAMKRGATREEIVEVLQLTTALGIHSCTIGVPIFIEELEKASHDLDRERILSDPRRQAIKAEFIHKRGYWHKVWEDSLLILDPDFVEGYLKMSAAPWANGPLKPKVKELIYIAVDVATTHLLQVGTHIHMQNAIKYGATREEIVEVLQLVSLIGIDSCSVGVPILDDVLLSTPT